MDELDSKGHKDSNSLPHSEQTQSNTTKDHASLDARDASPESAEEAMKPRELSQLATLVVNAFEHEEEIHEDRKMSVNPVVSKFATWYEKLRNAMEYREDEVILRATIERILKRRLLLGGNAQTTAEPLVRELIWARYLADDSVGEKTVQKVEHIIDLYLRLRLQVLAKHKISDSIMNEWTYHLMSSHLERVLHKSREEDIIANFMFQLIKDSIVIKDDSEDTKNAQVFLAVRKAFNRDDLAFLRFQMFGQIFGELTASSLDHIARDFPKGFAEINRQLTYPRKDAIYSYVKKQNAAFLIFEDVLRMNKGSLHRFLKNPQEVKKAVDKACEKRYESISSKVRTAIIRSVIFILLTKLFFAFLIEGTYERIVYGEVMWASIGLNTGIPPFLMIIVGFFLRTPDEQNTKRIYEYISMILYESQPKFGQALEVYINDKGQNPLMQKIFTVTWFFAFLLSFGGIIFVLSQLNFNPMSIFIFVFFLAIVSFLAYRISLTASLYRLGERQGLFTPIIDFLFVPVIRVGRKLTEGISQINVLLFFFDFVIETPFKALFAFFEQLFYFLHVKREELG